MVREIEIATAAKGHKAAYPKTQILPDFVERNSFRSTPGLL
jgi:hypothetical protein